MADREKATKDPQNLQLRLFIDTAEIEEIREAVKTGVVAGIAMNPGKVAQSGRKTEEIVDEIRQFFQGPISVQGISQKAEDIVKEAKELAKLDHLESEYWRAWERSQEEAETFTDADKARGGGYTYKIERRDGNPAFLSGVMDCIRKRCDILGVGAPKEQDIGDKGSKDLFEGRTAIEELRVRLTRIAERSLAAQHPEPN